ncbi:uncharacterized protein LOC143677943 isoform X2 [Tamandua tetradactyla]|uniref:uncharacterized protein LOC143677943 isoform X2 n=1 Tax=Tamandua tetradactyla TaxID=48850 RepID=UPI0040538C9C
MFAQDYLLRIFLVLQLGCQREASRLFRPGPQGAHCGSVFWWSKVLLAQGHCREIGTSLREVAWPITNTPDSGLRNQLVTLWQQDTGVGQMMRVKEPD